MNELTNLLPPDRIRALSRDYLLRLATVALTLIAALVLIHAALLWPSYLYLSEEMKTREAHLKGISSSLASSEEQQASERLAAVTAKADTLLSLVDTPSAAASIRSVLSVPLGGVRLQGISLTLPPEGSGQMRLSGVAPTRESLRQYHSALGKLPFIENAELPLSVYAEEQDLPFSILLTGSFKP